MIRAVAFDWGGVLMRTVDVRPRMAWEQRLGLRPCELDSIVFGSAAWQETQYGKSSVDDVWREVAHLLGIDRQQAAALSRDFWAGDQLDAEMVALIHELKELGLRVALLSNQPRHLPHMLAELGVDGLFDVTVISAFEGTPKPDPAIYRLLLDRLGMAAQEVAFVDDLSLNVRAAQALGLCGVRFRGVRHLRRALVAAGVPVKVPPLAPVSGVRAVIFDWGGVLVPLTFRDHTTAWEKRLGLEAGAMDRVLWGPAWKQLEIGAISQEDFDDQVAQGLGLPDRAAARQFYQEYYGNDYLVPAVTAAVEALRGRYQVALLSNAFPGHAEMARDRFGYDPRVEFDLYVNSAQVGLAKPDPAIYHLTLERLGVRPGEAVFVDDMLRNVDAAQMLGIRSLVFADAPTGLEDLSTLLGHPIG
ncbi:MAG: HAD family phosphatase [Anaerolineae bacterium]|nr:HAD family phosphatase [Anaerolineae bacterium]